MLVRFGCGCVGIKGDEKKLEAFIVSDCGGSDCRLTLGYILPRNWESAEPLKPGEEDRHVEYLQEFVRLGKKFVSLVDSLREEL